MAAGGDERAAAERDQLFEPAGSKGRADSGLCDSDSPTIEIYLEDRVRAQLGREPPDLTASESLNEGRDCVPKEAEHNVLGQVECIDRQVGFDHGLARWVEVEDRGVVWVGHGMLGRAGYLATR